MELARRLLFRLVVGGGERWSGRRRVEGWAELDPVSIPSPLNGGESCRKIKHILYLMRLIRYSVMRTILSSRRCVSNANGGCRTGLFQHVAARTNGQGSVEGRKSPACLIITPRFTTTKLESCCWRIVCIQTDTFRIQLRIRCGWVQWFYHGTTLANATVESRIGGGRICIVQGSIDIDELL